MTLIEVQNKTKQKQNTKGELCYGKNTAEVKLTDGLRFLYIWVDV